ncbi:hypothetical protein [Brevibacillus porteri]|uniref:Uncharacterized protein n=1 Tax=Brevibacillus porteri TaxID=2126350 RepID=A0ABX5FSB9_9BACL|nr:hypothetical protein [Brevibacillus porteri]MED1801805.1 hypothetical protein [Brevibacillus porteri]MED2134936.1 hypothetical protein [Brevibacillus porteri]MED2745458.1 hypothetical protein [Brevibacillus porteri]MED2815796.1 hypothetical protein [Brevibacillus porteri]MED2897634.1 hypothetical protein [Brevibacillus porteri]
MKWWNRLQWKRKRKKALRNIREGFGFWGIFMVDMTDDQLEQRIIDTAHLFGGVCFTAEEAIEALRKLRF